MSQSQPQAQAQMPPRRKRTGKRRGRRGGVSPFLIMALVGTLAIVALIALNTFNPGARPRAADANRRTLGQDTAQVTIEEFSDFQ